MKWFMFTVSLIFGFGAFMSFESMIHADTLREQLAAGISMFIQLALVVWAYCLDWRE